MVDRSREVGRRPVPAPAEMVANMRQRANRCRALGYTNVNVATDHLAALLDIAEKALTP